ncbi:zinc finger protein 846-like isoform X1 [Anastrepha obliqua]|uniref:zinc finger protein 846-like isoform X1 n=1 Tax=Anastrepha obliqua TaxID=95512 RepID=UPI00240A5258|nr:zinc finger protein 846-like isoform X1 [Anastrepha obliqua]
MDTVKICRACLSPEDRVHLLDWYQPIDSSRCDLSYKECFCKCTQINLSLKDDPSESDETRTQYLCSCCAQKLKDAYDFIEKARRADNELRCAKNEKVKLEAVENKFEWVPVEVKKVKINKPGREAAEEHPEDVKVTYTWNENSMDDNGIAISDDFEHGDSIDKKLANESDEHCMDEFGKLNDERKNSKNFKKRGKVKNKSDRSGKHFKRLDELVNCDECQKTMTRKALRKHKPRHKPKIFLCQACPKTFSEASGLKNHELIHRENRERYPCDKCNQTFLSRYSYKKHIQTHESNRKPIYQCTQCEKSFLHKNGLTIHELHHKGATIECNICQKRYVRQIDLDTHLRTHSGESPFVCHICDKSFIHKRILNRHLQYHEGYFSYTCLTCGAKFSKYDKYYSHRMQHTGLPYKCGSCEKQFPDAYKIKRHIRGVHKIEQDKEVEKLVVRINITKEHRGRIVEILKNPENEK